jgi:glycosyltransferase involved in cell wall biosynthesis
MSANPPPTAPAAAPGAPGAVPPITPETFDRSITIFVACYNEAANIVTSLDTAVAALQQVGYAWEIIVIDDASRDDSVAIVRRYIAEHPAVPVSLVVREQNQGLAQNYIDGAFLGHGKYYKLVCGDDAEPKETIVKILRLMGTADMVLPYYEEIRGRKRGRRIVSRTYTTLVNLISGYRLRYYNGVGIHVRYNVMRWHTNYHGFSFQADMVTRLLDQGASYVEVPAYSTDRTAGSSKALTLSNFLSVTHFLMDLTIRRVGRWYARRKGRRRA